MADEKGDIANGTMSKGERTSSAVKEELQIGLWEAVKPNSFPICA